MDSLLENGFSQLDAEALAVEDIVIISKRAKRKAFLKKLVRSAKRRIMKSAAVTEGREPATINLQKSPTPGCLPAPRDKNNWVQFNPYRLSS